MPLHDYACPACGATFETLVRTGDTPTCPTCGGEHLERLLSLPAVRSDATRAVVTRDTQRRDAAQARERVNEQRRYEQSHD
jgi:putative FmdB family regulatory protein